MYVVLDTNVIVSAFWSNLSGGCPSEVYKMCIEKKYFPIYTSSIIQEYTGVLNRSKFDFSKLEIDRFISNIKHVGICIDPIIRCHAWPDCIDKDDQMFFNASYASDAILVTGNLKHYPESNRILTPKEFLETLKHGAFLQTRKQS